MKKISAKTNPGQYDPAFTKETMDRLNEDLNKCLKKYGVNTNIPYDEFGTSGRNNHEKPCFPFAYRTCNWAARCPKNKYNTIEERCTALVKELKAIIDSVNS